MSSATDTLYSNPLSLLPTLQPTVSFSLLSLPLILPLLSPSLPPSLPPLGTGQTSGTAVPCTGEDNPPTPTPLSAPPTSPPSYDPHDYDEVPVDESGKTGKQHALYDELAVRVIM